MWLLDALDQTTTIDGFRGFFDTRMGMAARCPVLLTGRPYVLEHDSGKSGAFAGEWKTLRLDSFDRPRQRRYLGPELSARLLPDDELRRRDEAEYQKRLQWADLLAVPLLLKLMRTIARSGKLGELRNRHAIYASMVVSGNFTGVAEGNDYHKLRAELPRELSEALPLITQVNLTTLESVLDNPTKRTFKWRHLSFCEYFAGLELARGYPGGE